MTSPVFAPVFVQIGRKRGIRVLLITVSDKLQHFLPTGESCDESDFLGRNWANLEEKLNYA